MTDSSHAPSSPRIPGFAWPFLVLFLIITAVGVWHSYKPLQPIPSAPATPASQPGSATFILPPGFSSMGPHMAVTDKPAPGPGDQQRADAIADATRQAMLPFEDYRQALAAGYIVQYPELTQTYYHFVNPALGAAGRKHFDPTKPQFLLYTKETPTSTYKLAGVMYQTGFDVPLAELDQRIPISVAQWHAHINVCLPPPGDSADWIAKDKTFGLNGSITTQEACAKAGGIFHPHLGGWMTHVYPFETDPARRFRTDMDMDDDADHMPM